MINAWACENNLVLGQVKTDKKKVRSAPIVTTPL